MIELSNIKKHIYFKWLKLKSFWTLMFAHKPLCEQYSIDIFKINKVYICRSCTFLYSGMLSSVIFFIFFDIPANNLKYGAFFYLLIVLFLSFPKLYNHYFRLLKDLLRFSTGFLFLYFITLLVEDSILSIISLGIMLFTWLYYKRIKIESHCERCSENTGNAICSGFQLEAELSRVYEEKASEYLMGKYKPF